LITIVGPGGIGKTRLALAAGNDQAEAFTQGAAFVPLTAISSAEFLAPAILAALDVEQGQRAPRDQLLDYLRSKELLLVLDNVEQLLESGLPHDAPGDRQDEDMTSLLSEMLCQAPGVTLLVTSRERLALPGEWLFDLAGLSYPPGELPTDIEGYSAVRLFVQRASQVQRHLVLTEGEARAVARICRLVEGLPLAIELAAAALRTRSCTAIADAITTSLSALATGLRAVPERHRSMWAAFEHSWRLLSGEERQVFPRLSVFRGGFDEDAAAQIAQASPQILAALLDKSLLRWDGVAHYDMHELVRQYASEKLEQAEGTEQIRSLHAAYFLALAESADSKLRGAEQVGWLERLEAEHDNLHAALAWSLQELKPENEELRICSNQSGGLRSIAKRPSDSQFANRQEVGQRLVAALARFWDLRGGYRKVRALLADSVVLFDRAGDSRGRARVRCILAQAATWDGDFMQATALLDQALALNQALGNKGGCATTLRLLGDVRWLLGDYAQAAAYSRDALAFYREQGDRHRIAITLHQLADVTREQGDYARAVALFEECRVLYRELNDLNEIAGVFGGLGDVLLNQGNATGAATCFRQAVTLLRELKHQDLPLALRGLGRALQEQGNDMGAFAVLVESLTSCRELGLKYAGGACLAAMAGLWVGRGQPVRAARLFGASQALRGTSAAPIGALVYYTRDVASVRIQLDEATFAAAWAEGEAMTLEQAVAYALEGSEADSVASIAITAAQ
jgi:predicted ATPase